MAATTCSSSFRRVSCLIIDQRISRFDARLKWPKSSRCICQDLSASRLPPQMTAVLGLTPSGIFPSSFGISFFRFDGIGKQYAGQPSRTPRVFRRMISSIAQSATMLTCNQQTSQLLPAIPMIPTLQSSLNSSLRSWPRQICPKQSLHHLPSQAFSMPSQYLSWSPVHLSLPSTLLRLTSKSRLSHTSSACTGRSHANMISLSGNM